jgi:hypothetical protein
MRMFDHLAGARGALADLDLEGLATLDAALGPLGGGLIRVDPAGALPAGVVAVDDLPARLGVTCRWGQRLDPGHSGGVPSIGIDRKGAW